MEMAAVGCVAEGCVFVVPQGMQTCSAWRRLPILIATGLQWPFEGIRKSLVFRTPPQTLGGARHWLTFALTYLPAASAGHFAECRVVLPRQWLSQRANSRATN